MLFLKDLSKMKDAERNESYVRTGIVVADSRKFTDILDYSYRTCEELERLQKAMNEVAWTSSHEAKLVFQTEYGQGISQFQNLDAELQEYLKSTDFEIIKEKLEEFKNAVRERYNELETSSL